VLIVANDDQRGLFHHHHPQVPKKASTSDSPSLTNPLTIAVSDSDSTKESSAHQPGLHEEEMLFDNGDETQGEVMEVDQSLSQQSQGPLIKASQRPMSSSTPTKSAASVQPTPTPAEAPVVPRIITVRSFRKLLLPDTPTAAIRTVKFNWNGKAPRMISRSDAFPFLENMLFAMAANGSHKVWFHASEKVKTEFQ